MGGRLTGLDALRGHFTALKTESDDWLRLDMLRFLASVGIVWHHSQEYFTASPANREWALLVDLFFVISGFIISAIYSERVGTAGDIARFLRKRAARLLPLVLLTLALAVPIWRLIDWLGLGGPWVPDLSPGCIAHSALMLHAYFPCGGGPAVGGVSWSIGIEMALYALFPCVLLLSRRKAAVEAAFAFALAGLLLASPEGVISDAPKIWRGLPSFLFGFLLYKHRARLGFGRALPALLVLLFASLAIRGGEVVSLVLVYAVASSAAAGDLAGEAPAWVRKLAPLGSLTFSLYMWHPLFILVLMYTLAHKLLHLSGLAMVGAGIVCFTMLAVLSYWSLVYFENPMRRWISGNRRVGLAPSQ